ncbi:secretion system apparatus protein SsaU [Yersinia aldovae]|uniref:EscU/YscU/HrcU family type III secretion system export apparatus switch protein n=1 Tax=Yersinia aldovae TaxID=29483 RepID=UPI0005E985CA|nr:EscU/YscU/HrcU family type III secretion system export apparatus switch protein [Yersinia aldovae]CNH68099.1 secretion system apparatus protein SsaU [Yersinia aldovae]
MSEKTEQPTEKKKRDSRQEGQVIKSMEITSGIQLLTVLAFFHFFANAMIQRVAGLMLLAAGLINKPFSYAVGVMTWALFSAGGLMFALFGGMLAAATIASVLAQVGFMVASKALGFKAERISPVSNLKQIFSLRSLIELIKSCLKVILLCLIFVYLFRYYAPTFQALPYCEPACAIPVFSTFVRWMWYALLTFYVVLGVFDYAFQSHNTLKQQRMSKEDVKQEHKDMEGDPQTKKRRRELQREMQSGSLAQNVRQSAVVVRNPTHIAVCLGYDPVEMPVPTILEKGTDARAEHIVSLALRESIPVVENIALARQLFHDVKCGEMIPESQFEPVAALLRLVLEIDYDADTDK